ncbi:hypothetical protein V1264_012882 [Littorina saxatilis]|uniref:GH18 domain-containing protein n=1 Tax=Littorina saxatilis TaxID=31220 RepID=A0AAN9BY52_9CAEN
MLAFTFGFLTVLQVLTPAMAQGKVRMCYLPTFAQPRFTPDDLDPFLCTHVLCAFASISPDGTTVTTTDEEFFRNITGLKQRNPNLKVLLSVGGAGKVQTTALFDDIARSASRTAIFVNNTISFLRDHAFDGLDVDWEFPNTTNRQHFTNFIAGLSNGFSRENLDSGHVKLLLTIAVWGNHEQTLNSYEPQSLAQ